MAFKIGYLLPTRERAMTGRHEAAPLLELAERAEAIGLDSVWVGDSLTARARYEPLALLAAVAGRTRRVEMGTAVLLPALRNPVLLAHQTATLDRIAEGRLILGVGIAADVPSIRAEFESCGVPFEKRVGRMMEGLRLCRAIWRGGAVDWDGRWKMAGGSIAPTPHRPGGPPLWLAGHLPASLVRCGKYFDGWMPNGSLPGTWERHWAEIKSAASAAGRDPSALVGSAYVTASVDEDPAAAKARLDAYLESYYGVAALAMHSRQATFAGTPAALKDWIAAHKHSGVQHIVVRCVGDHEEHLQHLVRIRQALN